MGDSRGFGSKFKGHICSLNEGTKREEVDVQMGDRRTGDGLLH